MSAFTCSGRGESPFTCRQLDSQLINCSYSQSIATERTASSTRQPTRSAQAIEFKRKRRRKVDEEARKQVRKLLGSETRKVGLTLQENLQALLGGLIILTCVMYLQGASAASISVLSKPANNSSSHQTGQVSSLLNKPYEQLREQDLQRRFLELKQKFETNRAISDGAYYSLLAVYSVLIIFGTLSNALICLTVILKPQILSPRNIFIVNLAYSDLLLCVFTMPFSFIEISMKLWHMGVIPCKLVAGLQATSIFVSTISITAIALDRYKVIVYPTHRETTSRESNTKSAVLLLASVWIGALLLSSPLFYYRTVQDVSRSGQNKAEYITQSLEYCFEAWSFEHGRGIYSVISMIFQYVLPITIVSVVYAKISDKLQKRLIRRQRSTQLECQQKRQLNLIKRTHTMLVSVSLIFGLSWLPLNILNVLNGFWVLFKDDDQLFRVVFAICHLIGCSSACTNPILYAYLNENFRKELRQVYRQRARRLLRVWARFLRVVRIRGHPQGARSSSRQRYPGGASSTTLAHSTSGSSPSPSSSASSSVSSGSSPASPTFSGASFSPAGEDASSLHSLNQSPSSSASPSSPLVSGALASLRKAGRNNQEQPNSAEMELTRIGSSSNRGVTASASADGSKQANSRINRQASLRSQRSAGESAPGKAIQRLLLCAGLISPSSSSSSISIEDTDLGNKVLKSEATPSPLKIGVQRGNKRRTDAKHLRGRKERRIKAGRKRREQRCGCKCHQAPDPVAQDQPLKSHQNASCSANRDSSKKQLGVTGITDSKPSTCGPGEKTPIRNNSLSNISKVQPDERSYSDQSKRVWLQFLQFNRSLSSTSRSAPSATAKDKSDKGDTLEVTQLGESTAGKIKESCKHCSLSKKVGKKVKRDLKNNVSSLKQIKKQQNGCSSGKPSGGLIEGIQIANIQEVIPLTSMSMMSTDRLQSLRNERCGYYLSVETGRKFEDTLSLSKEGSTSFLALSHVNSETEGSATDEEAVRCTDKFQTIAGTEKKKKNKVDREIPVEISNSNNSKSVKSRRISKRGPSLSSPCLVAYLATAKVRGTSSLPGSPARSKRLIPPKVHKLSREKENEKAAESFSELPLMMTDEVLIESHNQEKSNPLSPGQITRPVDEDPQEAVPTTTSSSRANSSSLYACAQHSSSLSCTCSSCHSNSYSNSSNFEESSNLNSNSNSPSIVSASSGWLVSQLEQQQQQQHRPFRDKSKHCGMAYEEGLPQVVSGALSFAQVSTHNSAVESNDSSSLAVLVGSIMRLSQAQQLLQHQQQLIGEDHLSLRKDKRLKHSQLQPATIVSGSSISVSGATATPRHPFYDPECGRKFSSVSHDR